MTDNTPKQADWSTAYPYTHAQYEQQARDAVDAQHTYLEKQKQPGFLHSGSLGVWELDAVMRSLQVTDPAKYQRIKAAQLNHEEVDISAILRGEA